MILQESTHETDKSKIKCYIDVCLPFEDPMESIRKSARKLKGKKSLEINTPANKKKGAKTPTS